ncbi:MAG: thiamine pyrophosphate-dependent enzyme, partial [Polyangiaceae bacterium]
PPVSSAYAQLLAENPAQKRVVLTPHDWGDPTGTATLLVRADIPSFCRALTSEISSRAPRAEKDSLARRRRLTELLVAAEERARRLIDSEVRPLTEDSAPLTEAVLARAVVDACPAGSLLVAGNSSPVRDLDAFAFASDKPLRVLHQRGAAGIDGLVSGAIGAQHASLLPVTLLLGDLSFLHDLTGLALAGAATGPVVIVVADNSGGRIFEQLPVHDALGEGAVFERLFATPQSVDMASAAATFGVAFARATTPAELRAALSAAHARETVTLLHAVVPPHDGARLHKNLRAPAAWKG